MLKSCEMSVPVHLSIEAARTVIMEEARQLLLWSATEKDEGGCIDVESLGRGFAGGCVAMVRMMDLECGGRIERSV